MWSSGCATRDSVPRCFFRDSHGNEVDLLIRRHGMLVPVEIKSARTFSTEFLKGIERFRQVAPDGRVADGFVLFDGEQRHEIKGVRAVNPLLHDDWLEP